MKSFGPKKFQIPCTNQKVSFWQFFIQGRDGCALLVRPSRIPHRISKILFALGAEKFLALLEGKIRETLFFFKVRSGKITVCFDQPIVRSISHCFCPAKKNCPVFQKRPNVFVHSLIFFVQSLNGALLTLPTSCSCFQWYRTSNNQ